jgi:hypothetical protein
MEEEDFEDFLKELIQTNCLDQPVLGISKQAVGRGIGSLSVKQRSILDRCIMAYYFTEKCARCCSDIPWSEMSLANNNGGYCGWCEHQMAKDD